MTRNKRMSKLMALVLTLVMVTTLLPAFATANDDVPEKPDNVHFSVTDISVTITWDAVAGATGYNVYRRAATSSTLELLGAVNAVGYFDNTVEEGTDYYYAVSAVNAAGEGPKSEDAFIMLANDDAVLINSFQVKVRGSRLRLGDLTGDGRTDILVCHTTSQSNYTTNGSVLYVLLAYDITGELLWEFSLDPNYNPNDPNSGVNGSSADEPVNIMDVDGDGLNDVVALMHPQKNRAGNYTGAVIVVLDGTTGTLKKDSAGNDCRMPLANVTGTGLTSTTINTLGDCFAFGNFDGREIDNQFIVLKARYSNVTILEMFNQAGEFKCNFVFRQSSNNTGQTQSQAGHMPLVADLDGDGIDELISNYSVYKVDTDAEGNVLRHATGNAAGQPIVYAWWWIKNRVEQRSGATGRDDSYKNNAAPAYYTGTTTQIVATDHVDTIQVGYVFGEDGPLCVVFGGGGPDGQGSSSNMTRSSTFCYTWDGVFQWVSNSAIEPQSLNLAEFRTDSDGLMLWGLDRRTRGGASNSGWGRDSMFLTDTYGELQFLEYDWNSGNPMGWSTIVIRVDNWTGTYAPMCLSFNRNTESRAGARDYSYPAGAGNSGAANRPVRKALWMADYREPALYDGYANTLFKMPVPMEDRDYMFENNVDWRFMATDLCGDSRTELIGYDDSGRIRIYYNNSKGDIRIDADGNLNEQDRLDVLLSTTSVGPKPQNYFMGNYTRYPTDVYFSNIQDRIPAQAQALNVKNTSAFITWTPIINAESYTLYRDGVPVYTGADIGFAEDKQFTAGDKSYTVVAHARGESSPPSAPLVVSYVGIVPGSTYEDFTAPADLVRHSLIHDLLVMWDGTVVDTPEQWVERRAEVRRLLEFYFYGPVPIDVIPEYYQSHTVPAANNSMTVNLMGGLSPTTNRTVALGTITYPTTPMPEGGYPLFLDAPNAAFWRSMGYATAALPTARAAFDGLFGARIQTQWDRNTGAYGVAAWNVEVVIQALKIEAEGANRLRINPDKVAVSGASTNGKRAACVGAMAESLWLSVPGSGGTGAANMYRQNSGNSVWNMFTGPSTLANAPGSLGNSGNNTTGTWGPIGLAESWGGHAGWDGNYGGHYRNIPYLNADFAPIDIHFVAAMYAREGKFFMPATGVSLEGTNGVPGLQITLDEAGPAFELAGVPLNFGARVTRAAHGVDIEASVVIMVTVDHAEGRHGDCDGFCDLEPYLNSSVSADAQRYLRGLNFHVDHMKITPFKSQENYDQWIRILPCCNGDCSPCMCPEWCPHTADGLCCDPGVPPIDPDLEVNCIIIDFGGADNDANAERMGRPRQSLGWNQGTNVGTVSNGILSRSFSDHGGGIIFNLPLGEAKLGNFDQLEFRANVNQTGAEANSPIGVTFTQDRSLFPGSGNWWDNGTLADIRFMLPHNNNAWNVHTIDLTTPYLDDAGKPTFPPTGLTNMARWATGNVSLAIGGNARTQAWQYDYIWLRAIGCDNDCATCLPVVTLDPAGGEVVGDALRPVLRGEALDEPADPVRAGYYFLGWFLDGAEYDFSTPVFNSFTLVAQWEKIPLISVKIGYNGAAALPMMAVVRGMEYEFYVIELNEGALYDVTWSVNNANLASVDQDGKVTIKGNPGNVTLTIREESGLNHSIILRIT